MSVYLHVPYCREICAYCGCHTFATQRADTVASYTDTLLAEIAAVGAASTARRVVSIAWGGGSPNMLGAQDLARLMAGLRDAFDLSQVSEHAAELDPRLVTAAQAEAFAAAGVTRVSLGVQDLNSHVQAAIGRVQPLDQVEAAVAVLRGAGLRALNLDVMYGLPHQSVADARRTAALVAALKPDRVAAFGYAHVPWFKARQRLIDEAALPDTETRMAQAAAMRQALLAAGYVEIGFDHYAAPMDPLAVAARTGGLTRSFQGYGIDDAEVLIGLGASAISTYPQGYAQNLAEPGAYARAVADTGLATARGIALTADDRTRRAIINQLLCAFEVDLGPHGGIGAFAEALPALAPLLRDGLAALAGNRLTITPRGQPFARLVAEAFDAYRSQGQARHSRAV